MASLPMSPAGNDLPSGSSQMMTPNEAPKSGSPVNKETPSLFSIIKRLYEKSKASRKERDSKWDTYWDFFDGKQWPAKRPVGKASPNCNITASTINTIAPILTDTSPSFGVMAKDPKDYKFAELMTDVMKVWWDRRSMNHVLTEAIMDSLVTDVGLMKVTWCEELDDGLGDVEVTVIDPKRLYLPPGASDFDRNCPYVIHEFFKSRGELTLKFSKHAEKIKDAATYSESPDTSTEDTRVRVVSPVDQDRAAPDNKDLGGAKLPNDDIRVWECWMEDDTIIEEEQINQDTKEKSKVLKKKYPMGRMVTLLPDSQLVLQDVPNPYKDGQIPFVRIVDMLKPRSFYGQGEVQGLSETQRMINKSFAVIMDWANLMSNPCWVVDDDSDVDPAMLTSQVGQVIMKKPDSTVERMPAPPVPPQLFEMYHTLMDLADTQSGVHDVTQGRKPAGITAAQAIETLQEAAQTRIRLKERNLLTSLNRLGRMVISRILQYYTEPRVIRLTGRDDMSGAWPSYIKFYIEQRDTGDGVIEYIPNTQRIDYDESAEAYVEGQAEEGVESIGDFELDVTSGTSLPFIKQQRSEQAIRLYENKAIDRQALFDILELPDKDQILQRMTQEEEQAQQQQQQQPAQQPPPQGV